MMSKVKDLVRTILGLRVESRRGSGRPRLTKIVVRIDRIKCGIHIPIVGDRRAGKSSIRRSCPAIRRIRVSSAIATTLGLLSGNAVYNYFVEKPLHNKLFFEQ